MRLSIKHTDKVLLFILLAASLALKIIYIFYLTDYTAYLHSDAGGYWHRAIHRFEDLPTSITQWWVWPPFNHIMLAYYFDALSLLNLLHYKLEATLIANAVFSTATVALFYFTALNLAVKKTLAIALCGLLAFFFPFYYLNAFVLAETPALFFFALCLFCILRTSASKPLLLTGGAAIAIAAAFKPSLGISALPIGIFLILRQHRFHLRLIHASLFSLGFIFAISPIIYENYRISNGELRGLGGAAGINYFMKQCKVHKLEYREPGFYFNFVPAMTVDQPHLGTFRGQRPFHQQRHYFSMGNQCIQSNTNIHKENLTSLLSLFHGPFYPSYHSANGFQSLMKPSRLIIFSCFSLSILGIFFFAKGNNKGQYALLLAIIFSMMSVYYFLNVDHRHSYSLILPMLLIIGLIFDMPHSTKKAFSLTFRIGFVILCSLLSIYIEKYQFDKLRSHYQQLSFNLEDIKDIPPQGSLWNTPGFYKLFDHGIIIHTPEGALQHTQQLKISLDNNDKYSISMLEADTILLSETVGPSNKAIGMVNYTIELNPIVRSSSTAIMIEPIEGDKLYSFGGLRLEKR